jgi:hypothetical protein
MSTTTHRVDVVRIKEVRPHPNADRLEIIPIEGYQAIVAKSQFRVGDLGYYIPPDSVVPDRPEFDFLWKGAVEGPVPVKRRRIAAKRLRGEWSEGLLMPTSCLSINDADERVVVKQVSKSDNCIEYESKIVNEGDDVADFLGIAHYEPPEDQVVTGTNEGTTRGPKIPRTFRGWVNFISRWLHGERREGGPALPVYDVEALKKHMHVFQKGEWVTATEKIHGSNARYCFTKGLFGWGHMYAGSRKLWKALNSNCTWRRALKDNPWIEAWCKAHPGYALYGEVTPTQKCKDFAFDYGQPNKVQFFVFDVRTPDGYWMEVADVMELNDLHFVPHLYTGPFEFEKMKSLAEGPSQVPGVKHMREGVVIKAIPEREAHNLGRVQLKIVSNTFLEKDSKI